MNPNEQNTQPQQPTQPPAAPAPPSGFEQPIAPQQPPVQPIQTAPILPVEQIPTEQPVLMQPEPIAAVPPAPTSVEQQALTPTPTSTPEFQQPYQSTEAQPAPQTFAPTPVAPPAQTQQYAASQTATSAPTPAQPEIPEPAPSASQQFASPQVVPPEQPQGVSPYTVAPPAEPQKKSFNSKPIVIVMIVIIVLVVGYIGITFALGKLGIITNTKSAEINTLSNFSFVQPDASKLAGLTLQPSPPNSTITNFVSADTACSVSYGIQPQKQLPGEAPSDVVAQIVSRLKQKYGTALQATGPSDTDALVLKATNGKSYTLPSTIFKYSANNKSLTGALVAKYSISELSDKSHATVGVFCSGTDPNSLPALTQKVNDLAPVAAAIGIKVQ